MTNRPEAPRLRADVTTWRAAAGQPLGDLPDLDAEAAQDPRVAFGYGAAIAAALERSRDSVDNDKVDGITTLLETIIGRSERAGDRLVQTNALRVLAALYAQVGDGRAAHRWQTLVDLRGPQDADPLELAALAHHHHQRDAPEAARALLAQVPAALVNELGGTSDLGAVIDATGRLRAKTRALADDVLSLRSSTPADIHLIAELQRDGVGQVMALARGQGRDNGSGPPGAAEADPLRALTIGAGRLYVLEWLEIRSRVIGFLSTAGAEQSLTFAAVPAIPGDPGELASRMRARLNSWRTDRPGDPLDYGPWRAVEQWLHDLLADAAAGDHLVIVENEALAGLPWHAVSRARWTTSYTPGWTDLARTLQRPPRSHDRINVVSVSAFGDCPDVLDAFGESIQRTVALAQRTGAQLRVVEGARATRTEVLAALADSDSSSAPTWCCRPPAPAARPLIRGLGERLGIYGALRHAGTRSVVAPAWDCRPADVLSQLDRVHALLTDGLGIAAAVQQATQEAGSHLPPWRARALAVEGDWR